VECSATCNLVHLYLCLYVVVTSRVSPGKLYFIKSIITRVILPVTLLQRQENVVTLSPKIMFSYLYLRLLLLSLRLFISLLYYILLFIIISRSRSELAHSHSDDTQSFANRQPLPLSPAQRPAPAGVNPGLPAQGGAGRAAVRRRPLGATASPAVWSALKNESLFALRIARVDGEGKEEKDPSCVNGCCE